MAMRNLQRVVELHEELEDLERQCTEKREQIRGMIGAGLSVPGLMTIRPSRKFKGGTVKMLGEQSSEVEEETSDDAAADEKKQYTTQELRPLVQSLLDEHNHKAFCAGDVAKELKLTPVEASSTLYWLWHANKIGKMGRGYYRSLSFAGQA